MRVSRREFGILWAGAAWGQGTAAPAEWEWTDARRLTVEGQGFKDVKSPYDRLPARAEGVVRKEVWALAQDSAGIAVRFRSDATALRARWRLTETALGRVNMTAIAASGLDLYVKTAAGAWRWLGVGRPVKAPEAEATLVEGLPAGEREYMVYLPLYNGVTRVEFGVPKGAAPRAAAARPAGRKPIVFYGTSITQGASASRPGMTHPAILGRRFDREVINLGFSGNGRLEPEVVKFLCELDPAVYVIDCLPNVTAEVVNERAEACVRMLREARPAAPILLVEDRDYPHGFLVGSMRERNRSSQAALRAAYERLRRAKVGGLYYLRTAELPGADGEDTADGSHPSDLGFVRQADGFEKVLRRILKR